FQNPPSFGVKDSVSRDPGTRAGISLTGRRSANQKSAAPMDTLRTTGVYSPAYASRSDSGQSTLDSRRQDPAVPFALPRPRRCLSAAIRGPKNREIGLRTRLRQ